MAKLRVPFESWLNPFKTVFRERPLWYVGALRNVTKWSVSVLLREQGVAGSNPVILTSIYKNERPGVDLFSSPGPVPVLVQRYFLSDNLMIQRMMSFVVQSWSVFLGWPGAG